MVHKALALRARYERRDHDEMIAHEGAENWNLLHRCIIDSLMPECMICRDASVDQRMDTLRRYVNTMVAVSSSGHITVDGWDQIGSVLADFLNVDAQFKPEQ